MDYFAQGRQVDAKQLVYYDESKLPTPLTAQDIVATIRAEEPLYEPSAFLGGTKDPDSFKWLVAVRIGDRHGIHGYVSPRFMELTQVGHHLATGRYLAYSDAAFLATGRSTMMGGALLDPALRRAARRWGAAVLTAPSRLLERAHFQSVAIIQPIDFMPDGEMNMCDGCPDMTVHKGQLVWSCRLEEKLRHGCFLTAAPKRPAEGMAH